MDNGELREHVRKSRWRFFDNDKELAERVGVAPSTVTRWLAYKSDLRPSNLARVEATMIELEAEWNEKQKSKIKRVYFCQFDGFPEFIKIGCSNDLPVRMKLLSLYFPADMKLLASFEGGLKEENKIHHFFEKFYIRNEWFRSDKKIWDMIDSINNKTFDIDHLPEGPKFSIAHLIRMKKKEQL